MAIRRELRRTSGRRGRSIRGRSLAVGLLVETAGPGVTPAGAGGAAFRDPVEILAAHSTWTNRHGRLHQIFAVV